MAIQEIICAGWVESDGTKHPCGKHMGQKETLHPGVTHSVCATCMEAQLAVIRQGGER